MKEITIDKDKLVQAYKAATDEQKQLLADLYGEEIFRPQDITKRIKTIRDAFVALGAGHIYCREYINKSFGATQDVVAYMTLRIICAALNEGWEADCNNHKQAKWFPWFCFRYGGLVFVHAFHAASNSDAGFGARLAYKTKELAEYAGRQFVDIYQKLLL